MPNRMLKASILESEKINSLNWFEEVVFYRLIVCADDYGCMDGRITYLKNTLFPLKETVTRKSVEDAIAKLASVGLVIPYVDESTRKPYLLFPTWEKHQRLRNKHRKYPEPPKDCLTGKCQTSDGHTSDACQLEQEQELEQELEHELVKSEEPKSEILPFDTFWAAYPKKKAKSDARKAFDKLTDDDKVKIMPALELQKKSYDWAKDGGQYIPYPASWLNGHRWEDEVTEPPARGKAALDFDASKEIAFRWMQETEGIDKIT